VSACRYARLFPHLFVVVTQPRNTGVAHALNVGLETARAPLIARMDVDDQAHPDRFRTQVSVAAVGHHGTSMNCASARELTTVVLGTQQLRFLSQHSCVDVLGTGIVKATPSGAGKHEEAYQQRFKSLPSHPLLLKWSMLFYCSVAHPSVMARSKVSTVAATRAPNPPAYQ